MSVIELLTLRERNRNQKIGKKPVPTPPATPPSNPKSTLVFTTLLMLVSAFVTLLFAVLFSLPYVLAVAGLQGITAITFAILSLRESR